jgi:hypothetical protein
MLRVTITPIPYTRVKTISDRVYYLYPILFTLKFSELGQFTLSHSCKNSSRCNVKSHLRFEKKYEESKTHNITSHPEVSLYSSEEHYPRDIVV